VFLPPARPRRRRLSDAETAIALSLTL